jgi:hypothetical protein
MCLNIFITVLFILLWFLLQCCKFELLIVFATPLCIVDTRVANVTPVFSFSTVNIPQQSEVMLCNE